MLKVTLSVRPTKQNIKVFSMFLISIFCSFIQRQKFCVFKPYLLDIVFVRISTKTWKTIIISANDEHLHEKDFFVLHIFGQFSSQIIYIAFSLYNSRTIFFFNQYNSFWESQWIEYLNMLLLNKQGWLWPPDRSFSG